ncbi:(d)CMP kinase [bacterium]|nr:(d)CMP kinase [bacterium]MBU1153642.1 (d)CMP kinase [bacterium]MBU1782415.1 (d)CMP kinase [bacterium]MBU2599437.1 (d)CMP kinase [bacterium]
MVDSKTSFKQKNIIIAIDGPAASGKSTVAQIIAQKLNFLYIDSGAMYRALTWKVIQNNIDLDNLKNLEEFLKNTHLFLKKGSPLKVYIDGQDITDQIRDPVIDHCISKVAKNSAFRKAMVELQRSYHQDNHIAMDGRDIGTVVFPWADFKFYLEANLEIRAQRRYQELIAKGKKLSLEEVTKEMEHRDQEDLTRVIGPLRCAEDAIKVNTSDFSIDEVSSLVLNHILKKGINL